MAELLAADPAPSAGWKPVAVFRSGSPEDVRSLLPWSENPPVLVLLDDGSLAEALGVDVVPASVLLDAEGRVRARRSGYQEPAQLRRLLEGGGDRRERG